MVKQHPHLLLPTQASLDLLSHMIQMAEQLTHSLHLGQSLLLCWAPFKTSRFFRSLSKWARIAWLNKNYIISKIQSTFRHCASFFMLWVGQVQQYIIYLRKDISICPTHNFTKVATPQFFARIISHPVIWESLMIGLEQLLLLAH